MESKLDEHGITCVRLQSSRAFHSKVFQKIAEPFLKQIQPVQMGSPSIPWLSTYSGSEIGRLDPGYWIHQMLQPVQFQKACTFFNEENHYRFFEVGPGSQLSGLIRRNLPFVKKSDLHHSLDDTDPEWRGILNGAAQCWISGKSIHWNSLYPDNDTYKVSLPGYPFAETTYWLPEPPSDKKTGRLKEIRRSDTISELPEDWIYKSTFERSASVNLPPNPLSIPLFLICNDPFGDSLEAILECSKRSNIANARDLITGFPDSMEEERVHIVCYLGKEDRAEDLYHFNQFMSALSKSKSSVKFLVTVLCTEGIEITGDESVQPLGAAVAAYLRDLQIKLGPMSLHYLDIQKNHTPQQIAAFVSKSEVTSLQKEGYREFFYRGRYQWNRVFHPATNVNDRIETSRKEEILPGDLCLITGGTGALGLHLASWLKEKNSEIILLSRRSEERLTTEEIEGINDLKSQGGKITLMHADITRSEELRGVKESIRIQFGKPLDHIFHLAGTVSETAWDLQSKDEFLSTFEVKCTGLKNLLDHFNTEALKSITLYSSLSVYTGGFAGPAYSASCAMMDSEASKHIPADKLRVLNWGGWKEGGMAIKLAEKSGLSDTQIELLSKDAFSFDEGTEMLDRIMALKPQTLMISKRDLNRLINESSDKFADSEKVTVSSTEERYQRPDIGVEFMEPSNDTESKLAAIWQEALGLDQIGTDDNFFDLGADSMMMIHVTEQINRAFQKSISKTDLFEFTTIRKLAEHLSINGIVTSDSDKQDLKSRTDKKKQAAAQQAKRALELRRQRNRE